MPKIEKWLVIGSYKTQNKQGQWVTNHVKELFDSFEDASARCTAINHNTKFVKANATVSQIAKEL